MEGSNWSVACQSPGCQLRTFFSFLLFPLNVFLHLKAGRGVGLGAQEPCFTNNEIYSYVSFLRRLILLRASEEKGVGTKSSWNKILGGH